MFHNIIRYTVVLYLICMLTNNAPIGWGIFSVLTSVNVNSPIIMSRGGGGGEAVGELRFTSA